MSIRSNSKLKKLQAIGKIVRAALDEMSEAVAPVSRPVERKVRLCGFSVMRELCGRTVGRTIHEEPSIPNHHDPRRRIRLSEPQRALLTFCDVPKPGIFGFVLQTGRFSNGKLVGWDDMSANNGDKSRYGRQRKSKINRRLQMRALRKALVEAKKAK